MSYAYPKTSYSTNAAKSSSLSHEDSKKKTSLLKDNSWIKRNAEEDEAVDQDPNFGRVVLNKIRPSDAVDSSETANSNSSTTPITKTVSSVEVLKKRFGGSQDDLSKGRSTVAKTTVPEELKKKSMTTSIKSDTTTPTSINPSQSGQSVSISPVVKLPTVNTESFTERVLTSKKRAENNPVDRIPTSIQTEFQTDNRDRVKTFTTTSRTSSKAEDDLFDTLLPTSLKSGQTSHEITTTVTNREKVSVDRPKEYQNTSVTSPVEYNKSTTYKESSLADDNLLNVAKPTKTVYSTPERYQYTSVTSPVEYNKSTTYKESSFADDNLLNTLVAKPTKAVYSTPESTATVTNREKVSVDHPKGYQYTSVTSPVEYNKSTTNKESSLAGDNLFNSLVAKPTKTVYSTPERVDKVPISSSRTVSEKDLCSYCRTPMSSDPKIVLEDMKINCHTTCFKCEVCSSDLGHLKAGDSMWVYRRTIHCERCFEVTREKWHR
ncbi:hypothetical protein DPEC_G00044270 [Dallia pectoralis]|uniref:Uncharacterized protein n=1 Tax=Dallia pectoralis TaxID=75939 RepID=A0ACC2H9R9_DALPE|nr:hypothetical protein DPEC_G00044270 [Dallia pectoralis]